MNVIRILFAPLLYNGSVILKVAGLVPTSWTFKPVSN